MSGFAGIVSLDGAPPDERLLARMAQTLAFRGPDGTHITTKPGAGFCFTFLRTGPAPQCPAQPCSLDGKVWLLGDVRLDGRNDLRRKLEQHGDSVSAEATDEELVLRTWKLWGEEGIADLIGDYAFALWDSDARSLRCWRDLMGARPFFYAHVGNHFYFSNTLNAVRCAPDVSSALDDHFIGDFLLQGWCSYPDRTVFRDLSRLSAGHLLLFSGQRLETRRFTSLPVEEPLWLKREEEYVEQFRAVLETAVAERLPAGPAAIFMSGGLDSTSVAAVSVRYAKQNGLPLDLRAFTVDYRPLFDDQEGTLASRVARHLGIGIEVASGGSYLPFDCDGHLTPLPEPLHEPYHRIYLKQLRRIAAHSTIAMTGYGGDTVMNGQAWPHLLYLLRRFRFFAMGRVFGGYILKHRRIPPLRGGFRHALLGWISNDGLMDEYPEWLTQSFAGNLKLRERWRQLQQPLRQEHPFHPQAFATLGGSFWSNFLEKEDSGWHFERVESRAPLLDSRMLRFLLRTPPVPWCADKALLRQAVHGQLPEEISCRPKAPLQGDPLSIQVNTKQWSPLPLDAPAEAISDFVDWGRLATHLQEKPLSSDTAGLHALSLQHWLKSLENPHAFQYSRRKGKSG